MARLPVLKPREVARVLEKLGSSKFDNADLTNSIDT
jgi:predicted RNA binding protein YcfA (HicA-like mRNA interferase family)